MIDFPAVQAASLAILPDLLLELFPDGVRRGNEWVLGDLSGAKGRSLSINMRTCKFKDFADGTCGGDAIALIAHKFYRGDRIAAARDLSRRLGIPCDGPIPERTEAAAPAPRADAPDPDAFEPLSAVDEPTLSAWDHVYRYANADGSLIGYVLRKDNPKRIVPLNYGRFHGVVGWHHKHLPAPRPLYGLDLLADRPDAPVLLIEGEKATDAARKLFPEHVAVTWQAGTGNLASADFSPLIGRDVIIWPDADVPGYFAAADIVRKLPTARYVDVIGEAQGFDAADLQVGDPEDWLAERIRPGADVMKAVLAMMNDGYGSTKKKEGPLPSSAVATVDEPPPAEYDGPDDEHEYHAPAPIAADPMAQREGVLPLGHDKGMFSYYSVSAKQIYQIQAAQHTYNNFVAMASVPYFWERNDAWKSDKGDIKWDKVSAILMGLCREVGIYNAERVRGRGAWIDNGRSVLHNGDVLIVDGNPSGLMLPGSEYIYEAARPLTKHTAEPISTAEAHLLVEICNGPTWQHGISGMLLAGFLVVAPICGGLEWRPSIWITGGSGSGKSWIQKNVMVPTMGGLALLVQGETSAPGLRHELGCDAIPVLFDEAERESAGASATMQGVLSLIRQSSSEGGGRILKGTQSQNGAKKYHIRSCFALSSINVGIEHQADESRITVLALKERSPERSSDDEAAFAIINRKAAETITPQFAAGLLARSVMLLPVIKQNAETFARTISIVFGSRRTGDQLGALLAGAYALHSSKAISAEDAEAFVRRQDWGTAAGGDVERDELSLLSHITQHKMRINQGNGGGMEISIGRMINAARGGEPLVARDAAETALIETGIRYCTRFGKEGIYVSSTHRGLKKMMDGTPWAAGWARALSRLPGVECDGKTKRFGFGHTSKASWVPLKTIDGGGGGGD